MGSPDHFEQENNDISENLVNIFAFTFNFLLWKKNLMCQFRTYLLMSNSTRLN